MSRRKNTILDSAALGTGLAELVRPCNSTLRPADPGRVAGGPTFALTFSGGGFRATLAALGVVRYLADIGRLSHVRFVSSVSGGSIANGMLATQWETLRKNGFTTAAVDEHMIDPVVDSISGSSLKLELIRNAWRALGAPEPHARLGARDGSPVLPRAHACELGPGVPLRDQRGEHRDRRPIRV